MIDPLTRLRVGGSMDLSSITRAVTALNAKVDALELQVKLMTKESEVTDEGQKKVSNNRRKVTKKS